MSAAQGTTELATWLNQQLDADEQIARAADPGPWIVGSEWGAATSRVYVKAEYSPLDWVGTCVFAAQIASKGGGRENAAHIARHNPATILADIKAKRAIITHLLAMCHDTDGAEGIRACELTWDSPPSHGPATCDCNIGAYQDMILRHLAEAHSDRPGYRDEWRPA